MKKSFAEHYKNIMNQHDRNMNAILLDSITRDKNINNYIPKRGQKRRYVQISESDSEEQDSEKQNK